MTMNMNTMQAPPVKTDWKKRFGTIAAKIGADFPHRLGIAMPVFPPEYSTIAQGKSNVVSGRRVFPSQFKMGTNPADGSPCPTEVKAGTVVILGVQDITRHPDEADQAKWVCNHPSCASQKWASKRELLAAHPDQKVMAKQEEIHVYYAVVELPGVLAKPAKVDEKTGRELAPAVEAQPPIVMLLSDEE